MESHQADFQWIFPLNTFYAIFLVYKYMFTDEAERDVSSQNGKVETVAKKSLWFERRCTWTWFEAYAVNAPRANKIYLCMALVNADNALGIYHWTAVSCKCPL